MPRSHKNHAGDDAPSSSQVPASQAERACASMDEGEADKKLNDLVQYLLIMDQKKLPIKKQDINKHVLKEHSRAFPILIQKAAQKLHSVFGVKLVSLEDKQKGSYILINEIDTDVDDLLDETRRDNFIPVEWPDDDNAKIGLVMVILSAIFMNGEVMVDSQMWHMLKKLGVDQDCSHEKFGDVKKLVTQEFVRQGYLEYTRQPNSDPPVYDFRWGFRAKNEILQKNCLDFVSQLYDLKPQQWTSQWQTVQDGEEEENTQAT